MLVVHTYPLRHLAHSLNYVQDYSIVSNIPGVNVCQSDVHILWLKPSDVIVVWPQCFDSIGIFSCLMKLYWNPNKEPFHALPPLPTRVQDAISLHLCTNKINLKKRLH